MGPGSPGRIPSFNQLVSITRLKNVTTAYNTAPVQNNQLGTEFGSRGMLVGIVPTITSLGGLLTPHISAREFRLIFKYSSQEIHDHHGLLAR